MTYTEYVLQVHRYVKANPECRTGQAYMNVLTKVRPDICDKIAGTDCDPYYIDSRLPDFKDRVVELWNQGPKRRPMMNYEEKSKPEVITINLNLDWPFF